MGIQKGPEGVCQATRHPAKIYPFCMCQQPAEPDEWYCAEHLAERQAERERLLDAAKRSDHSDGAEIGTWTEQFDGERVMQDADDERMEFDLVSDIRYLVAWVMEHTTPDDHRVRQVAARLSDEANWQEVVAERGELNDGSGSADG